MKVHENESRSAGSAPVKSSQKHMSGRQPSSVRATPNRCAFEAKLSPELKGLRDSPSRPREACSRRYARAGPGESSPVCNAGEPPRRRRTRLGRRPVRLAAVTLAAVAHLPVRAAARQLGVSVNTTGRHAGSCVNNRRRRVARIRREGRWREAFRAVSPIGRFLTRSAADFRTAGSSPVPRSADGTDAEFERARASPSVSRRGFNESGRRGSGSAGHEVPAAMMVAGVCARCGAGVGRVEDDRCTMD